MENSLFHTCGPPLALPLAMEHSSNIIAANIAWDTDTEFNY